VNSADAILEDAAKVWRGDRSLNNDLLNSMKMNPYKLEVLHDQDG